MRVAAASFHWRLRGSMYSRGLPRLGIAALISATGSGRVSSYEPTARQSAVCV